MAQKEMAPSGVNSARQRKILRILEIWRLGSIDAVVNCQQNARINFSLWGSPTRPGTNILEPGELPYKTSNLWANWPVCECFFKTKIKGHCGVPNGLELFMLYVFAYIGVCCMSSASLCRQIVVYV